MQFLIPLLLLDTQSTSKINGNQTLNLLSVEAVNKTKRTALRKLNLLNIPRPYQKLTWICMLLSVQCYLIQNTSWAASPVVWAFWQVAATENDNKQAPVEHQDWQLFLDEFVIVLPNGRSVVAYKKVGEAANNRLGKYIQSLTSIDPRSLSRPKQMAYWINLYNALTVKVILEHPGKDSITNMGSALFSFGPWDDELANIANRAVTLNDIEHRILRPIWGDHRIHFAVNCAAVSCPNLNAYAFSALNLNKMLDIAEKTYLRHPRALRFDDKGVLHLSSIFKWYRQDFATDETQLLEYLAGVRTDIASKLTSYQGKIEYDYDWNLNSLE